ncbi:MAG: lysophospholipid acyltransferase family protein [Planctomycetota bacterium]
MAPRSALRNWFEFVLASAVLGAARNLPEAWVLGSVRALARVGQRCAVTRRREACRRVSLSLGLPPESLRVRQIVAGAFETLALNAVEAELVDRGLARGQPFERYFTVEGREHLDAARASGSGVFVCSAHFGGWELLPAALAQLGLPVWVVARPLDNPRLGEVLSERRLRTARGILPKDGGGLKLARALRAGEGVGLLLDQNAGQHGLILDFLGAPSSHHKVVGVLTRRFGALALPVYFVREPGRLHFRVLFEPAVRSDPSLDEEAAVTDVTQRLSHSLAAQVRKHPEQWLWLHDRWRHAEHIRALEAARGTNGA